MKFSPGSNPDHFKIIIDECINGNFLKLDEDLLNSLKSLPADMDFNTPDDKLNTILYLAAANNRVKTVDYLLSERKVDPNVKVSEKLTAAHIAAASGHTEILEKLVNCKNIQLAEQDQYGETPLFRALGNAPNEKLLVTVCLLTRDKSSISIPNEDNIFPIEIALSRKLPAVVQKLLTLGADVNKRCSNVAASMLMSHSVSNGSPNTFVFFNTSVADNDLRECAKLIINAYNQQHLKQDLEALSNSSRRPGN